MVLQRVIKFIYAFIQSSFITRNLKTLTKLFKKFKNNFILGVLKVYSFIRFTFYKAAKVINDEHN